MKSVYAILYCRLWPVRLYHISPHYLKKDMNYEKKSVIKPKMFVLISFKLLRETFLILRTMQQRTMSTGM
jgi:hypothetical protein